MIINKIVRKFSSVFVTAAKAKLSMKMLEQNPIANEIFKSLMQNAEIEKLGKIFDDAGYEIRIAGGAVRDLLCGHHPYDLDLATSATPQQMLQILKDKVRVITTPAGERHGTVTARVNDKSQYEITTLRIDKVTDGRHAEVEFTNDWKLDSSRRDLTINSMFLGFDGTLYDYFNGENDLRMKNIRFVGDANDRIKEDYLRIFRYFRFHARYGAASNHNEETLSIIKNNLEGLMRISGERIWTELKRILIIRECSDVIHVMFNNIGIGKYIGFVNSQTNRDLKEFDRVITLLKESSRDWDPVTLFASIIHDNDELFSASSRLKFSNIEKETIIYIITTRDNCPNVGIKELKIQLALSPKSEQNNLKRYIIEYLKYTGRFDLINEMVDWETPSFPIRGHIIGQRVKQRKLIGPVINELKLVWAKNDFELSDQEMSEELNRILENEKYKDK